MKTKIALGIVVLVISALSILKPRYNSDMVGYIAVAEGRTNHQETYESTIAELRKIPDASYRELTSLPLYDSSEHMAQQLPIYSIKVLYVAGVRLFGLAGIGMARATVLVSVVAYCLMAFILWRWVGAWAIAIILCPPLIALVRLSTPDGLCTAILVTGIYCLSKRRTELGCALLVTAIWTRPDALIFSGLLLCGLWVLRLLSLQSFAGLSFASIGSYFVINKLAGGYGWSTLSNILIQPMSGPAQTAVHMDRSVYLVLLAKGLLPLENAGAIFLLSVFIAAIAWCLLSDRFYRMLLLASLSAIAIHYLLYPIFILRLMAPMLLTIEVTIAVAAQSVRMRSKDKGGDYEIWSREKTVAS